MKAIIKNIKRVGDWKSYYKSGEVSNEFSYDNGKRNKEEISYYKNGIVLYKTEKKGDTYTRSGFYKNGKLKYERQVDTGYYKSYYESGAIDIEATYLKRELVGDWKKYYENSKLEWIVNYKDGYRDGFYKQYYDNGHVKLEGNNSRDKVDGVEKRYLNENVLEWKGSYKEGELNNTWTKFDVNGEKIEKVKYKNGVASNSKYSDVLVPTKVAEGIIERVPIFPGCEEFLTNTTRKICMNRSVNQLIGENFNTELALDLNLIGKQRIVVNFKINKKGEAVNIKSKASHPGLGDEAIRVIELLPLMMAGNQRDKPVIVPFSIPIVFQVMK